MLTSCSFLSDPTVGSDFVVQVTPVDVKKGQMIFISIFVVLTTQTYMQHQPQKRNNTSPVTMTNHLNTLMTTGILKTTKTKTTTLMATGSSKTKPP